MNKRVEIPEKLIEEVKAAVERYALAIIKFYDPPPEELEECHYEAEPAIDNQGIVDGIQIVLSAVRDGRLDEALGVVERVDARDTGGKLWIAFHKQEEK